MQVPLDMLEPDTVRSLIESFVTREGTDYGEHEVPLAIKIKQVLRLLERGEAAVVFDEASETCNIIIPTK